MARGISTATFARRAAALALAAAAATGLSACSAGQVTQTDTKQTAIAGINVDQGDLALRDLQVEFGSPEGYAAGDDAPLRVWISNEGTGAVSLIGVRTDVAGDVDLTTADAETPSDEETEAPSEDEATSEAPAEDQATTDGEGEDATEEPVGGAGAEATDEPADEPTEALDDEGTLGAPNEFAVGPVEIAPAGYVRLDIASDTGEYLLLQDLTEPLRPGQSIEVTFLFDNGEEITVDLPVGQELERSVDPDYEEHPGVGH
ncbi:hypothetical protein L0U85_16210 [Glycomyces sp. L485]|uniref:hypothetical protein n=1 Tax=Glycomyces sp. L485 TaxID=2909235 RepID=UPI001F4B1A4F|nr:hypothetical protein [Glycomyces sp. L485]MCH7232384.1 hypothetical protein [Glycomyces sp. L485]